MVLIGLLSPLRFAFLKSGEVNKRRDEQQLLIVNGETVSDLKGQQHPCSLNGDAETYSGKSPREWIPLDSDSLLACLLRLRRIRLSKDAC